MTDPSRYQGIPEIIYGTAWKFDKSASLVEAALKAGFRALDTAGSKGAYREALVGEGIAAALASGTIDRRDLYIQTKFSPYKAGRDPKSYPYDTTKSIPEQVAESIASSLVNLRVTYVDCLILHSLYPDIRDTLKAWRAMEALVPSQAGSLGVSETMLDSLAQLYDAATIKPRSVQNRFTQYTIDEPNPEDTPGLPFPLVPFDRDVREYCLKRGIVYAPWGMLWGSLDHLDGPEKVLTEAGQELGLSREIVCYALIGSLGGCQISLLCGTTNEGRMHDTLEGLAKVQRYVAESTEHERNWDGFVGRFKAITDGVEVLK